MNENKMDPKKPMQSASILELEKRAKIKKYIYIMYIERSTMKKRNRGLGEKMRPDFMLIVDKQWAEWVKVTQKTNLQQLNTKYYVAKSKFERQKEGKQINIIEIAAKCRKQLLKEKKVQRANKVAKKKRN